MKRNALLSKCYTRNHIEQVFIFRADHYRQTNQLHTYHNHKHVWSTYSKSRGRAICGQQRSRQIEKICRMAGFKCEKEYIMAGRVGL